MPQFRFELRRLQLHDRSAPLGRLLDIDFRFFLGLSFPPDLRLRAIVCILEFLLSLYGTPCFIGHLYGLDCDLVSLFLLLSADVPAGIMDSTSNVSP